MAQIPFLAQQDFQDDDCSASPAGPDLAELGRQIWPSSGHTLSVSGQVRLKLVSLGKAILDFGRVWRNSPSWPILANFGQGGCDLIWPGLGQLGLGTKNVHGPSTGTPMQPD